MLDFWRLPGFRICAAALLATLALLVPLLIHTPIAVVGAGSILPVPVAALFVTVLAVSAAILVRYKSDGSRPALAFKWLASRVFNTVTAVLFMMVYSAAAVPLCYLTFALGLPMQDAAYAAFDHAVGFDWNWWLHVANDYPRFGQILIWSYESFVVQMFGVIALLAFTNRTRELWEFLTLVTLGSLITIVISGMFPAVAAYAYYQIEPQAFAALDQMLPGVGRLHVASVQALHDGNLQVLDVRGNHGLVTFPSYHAFLCFAIAYTVRGFRLLALPAVILNILMLIATVPVGGHYVADLYGGFVIFLGVAVLNDRAHGRASMRAVIQRRLNAWEAATRDTRSPIFWRN